ncbi:transcriptional regulator [Brevibacillus reuszeri]|uniref:Transcriptional regulator n=1 Tax=Brevibacillus reuszeri TaxID=54915 RepID=A0A0K9YJW9_9BACL|nr:metalloregulator ArsR/SmtB family transcription factor [Brevibacillus reuszeri]KNB68959.1 transcriptional regulator [Brevibacillus reuszeri]MED1859411.1 metalloregulator ArsR/SmtB family transcription factor [Brevibacillus reuszeri]GED71472.1 transcriptional regulator [Brevibacillus reuszeri]
MNILNIGSERTTYHVELAFSPLFEAALGIAAVTYDDIRPTLEQPAEYWEQLVKELDPAVQRELDYAKQYNTWKTLLQLLHQRSFADLSSFLSYITELSPAELRYQALPYLGDELQIVRHQAASGKKSAILALQNACSSHLFFPAYIAHIAYVEQETLRNHLLLLMKGWYDAHIKPRQTDINRILERDFTYKKAMRDKLSAEAFVEWATHGSYPPEPAITRVLLIPHVIYRPWTIHANDVGTKIFYYPVADDSLHDSTDPYRPPQTLVQTLKVLGDEHRLRLVKMLSEKELSLQELTERLGGAKSTVHHHLSLLRSAYLVESKENKYRLKREALDKMPALLQQFLGDRADEGH